MYEALDVPTMQKKVQFVPSQYWHIETMARAQHIARPIFLPALIKYVDTQCQRRSAREISLKWTRRRGFIVLACSQHSANVTDTPVCEIATQSLKRDARP